MTPAAAPPEDGAVRGDRSRTALLLAAAELFAEGGRDGATTRGIVARTGQNIAAIAYCFGGKEGLYLGVAEEIVRQPTGLVAVALGSDADSREAVVRAHAILGQVLGFRVARAVFLRRAGLTAIGRREAALIARVVGENAEAMLASPRRS